MTDRHLQFLTSSILAFQSPMRDYLVDLHHQIRHDAALMLEGSVADSLSDALPTNTLGIAIATVDGKVFSVGDESVQFPLRSLSRGLIYGLALEDWGREYISQHLSMKPSEERENAIVLGQTTDCPPNPLVASGGIVATSLIRGKTPVERLSRVLEMLRRYTGRDVCVDMMSYLGLRERGYREQAIAHFLKQFNLIENDLQQVIDLYFQHHAIHITCVDLAMIGATLANGGVNPVTGDRAIAADYVQDVISVLLTCGMGEQSGEWTHQVGIPTQGSLSGGVMASVPQKLGLGVFAPRLDSSGNSVLGLHICKTISQEQHLHLFDIYEKNQSMQRYIDQVEKITAIAAAIDNDEPYDLSTLTDVLQRPDELGQLARVFNNMVVTMKAREQQLEELLNAFRRFVPHEFLSFLQKESITDIQLGDHVSKEMAVMFSDIRSFTALSESMTPQETFDFVNTYLRYVSPEIRSHNGFVVKFLGDGMMAVFPNGADDAIAAGMAVFNKIHSFNVERSQAGFPPIRVGMGIHVGNMMVGMVGERDRLQGDTLSDTVNLTARLEGLTKYYGVSMAISGDVLQRLSEADRPLVRFIDQAIVKGRSVPISVYEVLDVEDEALKTLKLESLMEFKQGLDDYCAGNWTDAKVRFEQIVSRNPLDCPAKLYLERIAELTARSRPADWNGVWVFTQK